MFRISQSTIRFINNFLSRQSIREFIRWGCVGVIATGIHYGIYYLLQKFINENIAYTLGYAVSFIANFYLTTYFTFRVRPSLRKGFGFGVAHVVNYFMHMGFFNLFLFMGVSKEIAPIPVFFIVVPINFLLVRFVFKHKTASSDEE